MGEEKHMSLAIGPMDRLERQLFGSKVVRADFTPLQQGLAVAASTAMSRK
jgi:hypothetical protein